MLETYQIECDGHTNDDRILVVLHVVERVTDPRREIGLVKARDIGAELEVEDEVLLPVFLD